MNSQLQTASRQDVQQRGGNDRQDQERGPFVVPPVDVFEDESGITLMADLPGVSRERLGIRVMAKACSWKPQRKRFNQTRCSLFMARRRSLRTAGTSRSAANSTPRASKPRSRMAF